MIYLDNGATSFPKPPEVIKAINDALAAPASPGRSGHAAALNASRTIHRARKSVARLFGLPDNSRLAFTSNVTWSLNLALNGLGLKTGDHVLSSALEHNSTARPLARFQKEIQIDWEVVPPGPAGLMLAEDFQVRLRPETRLVVLNHASNVTGALAPAKAIKEAIGTIPLLLDTAQTAGSLPMDDYGQWADLIAFTGHKGLLGPTGTGGLWIREGLDFRPLAVGGSGSRSESLVHPDFLPDALEPGTANTHGLAGLAAGVEFLLNVGLDKVREHEMGLTQYFLENIVNIPGLSIIGPGPGVASRVATVSVVLEGWSSSDLAASLEKGYGIMIRSGLHCAPLTHQFVGTFPGGASRFSIGYFNTLEDVQTAARALAELAAHTGHRG
ncbi:MAG: aminotransferase class V-fold PLP-dependent enzyme [Deltaproteobacteria bacterium]|jgi:cysteine desulfurase family protein|nr:aminotransferase class V-fold PLP-dependent enzyme [Deltaproteobacteria bacterium]